MGINEQYPLATGTTSHLPSHSEDADQSSEEETNKKEETTKESNENIHNEPIEPIPQEIEANTHIDYWMHANRRSDRTSGREPSENFQETSLVQKDNEKNKESLDLNISEEPIASRINLF